MNRLCNRNRSHQREGAVIVLVVVSLLTLLVCAALAVDVGYICALTAEQQNNADAASLAGASGLQDEGWEAGYGRALENLGLNQKPQGYLSLDDQVIELGWWDSVAQTFNPVDDPEDAFAVRVRAARNNANLFFARVMGHDKTDVRRSAVALGSQPCGGVWGLEGIRFGSIQTDSFDSTVAPYSETNAGDNGNLCSGRGIEGDGSFEVNGDVMTGYGYQLLIDGISGQITGLTSSTVGPVEPPPYGFGNVAVVNDNATIGLTDRGVSPWGRGTLALSFGSSDNLTLAGGTYYFNSIALTGGATITVTGPATFYVTGNISASGGALLNSTGNPGVLSIICTGKEVKFGGGVDFHGSILAPLATVTIGGNAEYYGALIGRRLVLNGDITIHVDESLPLNKPWHDPAPPVLVQ